VVNIRCAPAELRFRRHLRRAAHVFVLGLAAVESTIQSVGFDLTPGPAAAFNR